MTATTAPEVREKRGLPGFATLQRIGRSLMLPIASLPAAALLLRLGQPDMLGRDGLAQTWGDWLLPVAAVLGAAGDALFTNLPLLFALGVAVGYARKSDGSTALAAVVGYLVFTGVSDALSPYVLGGTAAGEEQPLIDYGVLGGIVIGLVAALLFQRYHRMKLPPYLAFFGGRRFVPIVTAGAAVLIAVAGALVFPWFDALLAGVGTWVTGSTVLGAFVYGTVNRLLIPFGLHHLLNSLPWFQLGEFEADGEVWRGDVARFLHGDPTAGTFMTGLFPIMMFALPAAALAMVHTARPERRTAVASIMGSAALVSFVTGVTEPLEFAFVYVAYPLYVLHAVLTGTSFALVNALEIRHGFGFSAGVIDYLLNFRIADKPLLLLVVGTAYGLLYYLLFRVVIIRWNLRTPGREDDGALPDDTGAADEPPDGGSGARPGPPVALTAPATGDTPGPSATGDAAPGAPRA